MLDEIVQDYRVKLDPNIFDYDKYEKDLESELKKLNDATDNYNNNNILDGKNPTFLEEKCRNLESQIKSRDKEIELLKKKIYGENQIEERVIIDYLQDQLKTEKLKYENYLNYTLKENKKLIKKQEELKNDKNERRKRLFSGGVTNLKANSFNKKQYSTSKGKNKIKNKNENGNNNNKTTVKITKKYIKHF